MYKDVHTHCRDWEQSSIATIGSVMKLARKYNFDAIVDMPNTVPKLNTLDLAFKRVRTARDENIESGYYFNIGIDAHPIQIHEAVIAVNEIPECVGIKMYTCPSTNDDGIQTAREQAFVYRSLVENDYDGVLTVHCESTDLFRPIDWDLTKPYKWNEMRPELAEVISVHGQIQKWEELQPKFHLHIAHVSSPYSLDVIQKAKQRGVKISCGVTPHHLLFSTGTMKRKNGSIYKVNPPLRDEDSLELLRKMIQYIDVIETDHAPHDRLKKRGINCDVPPSGIQSLHLHSVLVNKLYEWGLDERKIFELTLDNPKKIFSKILE